MREIKRLLFAFLTLCFVLAPATVSFAAEDLSVSRLEPVSKEEEEIILNNLSIEKSDLSKEEQIALLTKGTAVVWDKTYKNEYKKSF